MPFLDGIEISNPDKLYTWTIYLRQEEGYVARRHEAKRDGTCELFPYGYRHTDIDALRDIFRTHGLTNLGRQPGDALDIIETWI